MFDMITAMVELNTVDIHDSHGRVSSPASGTG